MQLVDHRPAPDHGGAALDEEADRHDLDAVVDGGNDLVLAACRSRLSGGPIICGIDGPNTSASMMPTAAPCLRQRRGEVGGDGRLAHAALARGHRDHVAHRRQPRRARARLARHLGREDDLHLAARPAGA